MFVCHSGIRRLLKFVSEKVASKFSDMRLLSLGNLLFLRFLNPGVLTPNPGIPGTARTHTTTHDTANPSPLFAMFVCVRWSLKRFVSCAPSPS